MQPAVQAALVEGQQISERLLRDFAKTPKDKLTWSPSPSARCALHIVAHCAFSLGFIREMLEGTPYPAPTTEQADAEFLAMEQAITTRQQALDLWEDRFSRYVGFLENFPDDQIDSMVKLPFGLGEAPMSYMVGIGWVHTREHIAQLEYLQTILGDRSW